jgi:hypothetical protein
VDGTAGEWALGKEFVAIFRDRPVPRMEGRIGAGFVIYHGEVNEDSDGPVEWWRPVPDDRAEALAASYPELTLRTEPAHQEAFIHLGNTQATPPRWQLVSETLHDWAAEHHPESADLDLGVRMTFLATSPITAVSVPTATSRSHWAETHHGGDGHDHCRPTSSCRRFEPPEARPVLRHFRSADSVR